MSVKTYPEPTAPETLKDQRPLGKVALGVTTYPTPAGVTLPLAESDVTGLVTDLGLKAPLASPALTGSPTATTAAATDNSTRIATDQFVIGQNFVAGALGRAGVQSYPPTLDATTLVGTVPIADLPTGTGASNVPVGGVITGAGPTGDASHTLALTYNAAGQLTAVTNNAIAIANTAVSGLGTLSTVNSPVTQTYVPTLAQGVSTNISKGVNTANYIQLGGIVIVWVRLTPTGTGTAGSDVTVSLPVAAVTTSIQVGSGTLALGANKLKVLATITAAGVVAFRRTDDATTTTNAGTAPSVAVASSGDSISFTAIYNAA